ncbi:MAG: PD-(D/E)XK nuclease family protein, partial [Mailhella sp.]|nr:PD-(D/E)XK nuclease family protein [Mailhella sp.]
TPLRRAGMLDQVAVVRDSVLAAADGLPPGSRPAALTASMRSNGMAYFFPWGRRLAALLEECAGNLVQAVDIAAGEDEVSDYAASILANLRNIQREYHAGLKAAGLSTPGTESMLAARFAAEDAPLPPPLARRKIILAGFVRLTKAQDVLFRYLWEHGARVCLHSDPGLAEGRHHWSCGDHAEWIRAWNAPCELFGETSERTPRIRFYAGYDLHSQLKELRREIAETPAQDGSRAVVLSHDSLLMAALHHIPEKEINISLGYPLQRSLLARLIERMFQTREGMDASGRVKWKDFLALLRHPYIRMLRPAEADGAPGRSLRPFLSLLERKVRTGSRLLHAAEAAADLADDVLGDLENPPSSEDICEETAGLLELAAGRLAGHGRLETLRDLAGMLRGLADLLLEYGAGIWPSFPLDAECLARLSQQIIPGLGGSRLSDERLDLASLRSVAHRVSLLDLTDDALPGAPVNDPLLPDGLRPLLGLPDNDRRERLAAHTFHRLIRGAREVGLYWQEGVKSGSLDGRKQRSRFIDELIWEMEKKSRKILRPGEGGMKAAEFPLSLPPLRTDMPVERTPAIAASVRELLRRPVSPTMIDMYLACPMEFFLRRVCGLRRPDAMPDGDDPLGVGNALHAALFKTYSPFLGKPVMRGDISPDALADAFRAEVEASGVMANLPPQSAFMLESSGPKRLRDYMAKQPDVLRLLALESELSAPVMTAAGTFMLEGTLDRIDLREEGVMILDYKSGKTASQPRQGFWSDDGLWSSLADWQPGRPDPLPDLADALPSAQLACYLHMWTESASAEEKRLGTPDAAWVRLADGGGEIPLFLGMDEEDRAHALAEKVPVLLSFLLRHMASAPFFMHRRTRRCEKCGLRGCCARS